jgi:hypothetical protein
MKGYFVPAMEDARHGSSSLITGIRPAFQRLKAGKKRMSSICHMVLASLLLSSLVLGEGARAPSSAPTRYRGNVLSIQEERARDGEAGFAMKLRTETGTVDVHLGPQWIQFRDSFRINQGLPIEVVGITFRFDKNSRVLAKELIQGKRRVIFSESRRP